MARKNYPFNELIVQWGTSVISKGIIGLLLAPIVLIMILLTKSKKTSENGISIPRRWLVLADNKTYEYDKAIADLGYFYLNAKNRKLQVGDIVYLFMSKSKRVRYETVVTQLNVRRKDKGYWITPQEEIACKLKLSAVYKGKSLTAAQLRLHGFKGEKSIKLPICRNTQLLDYIEEQFQE